MRELPPLGRFDLVCCLDDAVNYLAGEGELENELRMLATELQVADRVHFIGRCDKIPELLNASYACVLTSTAEGFSNSLIEYMAAGKPVVATDVGGAAEAGRLASRMSGSAGRTRPGSSASALERARFPASSASAAGS